MASNRETEKYNTEQEEFELEFEFGDIYIYISSQFEVIYTIMPIMFYICT